MLLSSRQACKQANLTRRELRSLRDRLERQLQPVKQNGRWYYDMSLLYALLDSLKQPRLVDVWRAQIIKKYGIEEHHDRQDLHPRQPRPTADPQ